MIPKRSIFALARALDGIPILGALENTPASRAGLRYGDVLISVNGMRTRTVADYVEAKALRTDGMEVVVFRAGAEIARDLAYDGNVTTDPAKILAELVNLRIGLEDEGQDPTGTA
jgi:C-terminal processing protease CtpA/Prc